jgi:hypothetical protein
LSEEYHSHKDSCCPKPKKPYLNLKPPVTSVQQVAQNFPVTPRVTTGPATVKVPVVLAETMVQIDLD